MGYWVQASSGFEDHLNSNKGKIYTNAGRAAISWLRGELPTAEHHFREAIKATAFFLDFSVEAHINTHELRAHLAQVVLQQRRLMEANAEARQAIEQLFIENPDSRNYSGNGAAPVAVMAAVLLEQGKVEDAEYLARIAVNMHESSCSEPQSLGITEARKIWIDALAEQDKWPELLNQIKQARVALANYPDLFELHFGTSLALAEAELNAGDADVGRTLASKLMKTTLKEDGPDSYRTAEIEGILALAESSLGQHSSALSRFSKALPSLVGGTELNATAINGRRQRILQGYMDLLVRMARNGKVLATGLNIPGELLRLSFARRLGRVQQAVSAGAVRAAVGNPELAKLVRQEQDLMEEARALGEALAYVQSAPTATSKIASAGELRKRLAAVDLARRTLRKEILERFPEYAELIAPKLMTLAEIASHLSPGQALLAFHVGNDVTYTWAMPSGGDLAFAEVKISRDELAEKIDLLRSSVDPGLLKTLEDIPDYDVGLAHELYETLLKPVEAGWKDAAEILVVADGPLGALPFSMLATAPEVAPSDEGILFDRYRDVAWLAKKVAVTALPSVNVLKTSKTTRLLSKTKRRPFVGFGDPFFSAEQALQATTKEVASRGFSLRAAPRT